MKIALFTADGLPNAVAVRQLILDHADEIAYVGVSDTHRAQVGGFMGQLNAHLSRSGMWIIPYLFVNFCLPDIIRWFSGFFRPFMSDRESPNIALAELCEKLNIPFHHIEDVNGASVREAMQQAGVELILSFHFDQIFKEKTLRCCPLGGVNVHPSLLPHHRGPFPTFHALMPSEPLFGVTIHKLAAKIDAGSILQQTRIVMPPTTTATRAATVLFEEGRVLVDRVLRDIHLSGQLPAGRQNPAARYYPWPSHQDMREFYSRGRRMVDVSDIRYAILSSLE